MRRIVLFLMPLIFGIISIIFGVMTGITSHQVTYQQAAKGVIAHFLAAQTTAYLQMQGNSTLYIIHEQDFTPQINGVQSFTDGEVVSFVYTPSESTPIDVTSKIGTHLAGNAYTVVAITAYDPNQQTHAQQIFMTAQYSKHPQGYYINNWPLGTGLLATGFALCGISLLLMRPKKQPKLNTQDQSQAIPGVIQPLQSTLQSYEMPSSMQSGTYPPFSQQPSAPQPLAMEQTATPSGVHQFFPQQAFQLPAQQSSHAQPGLPSQPVPGRRSLLSYASQAQSPQQIQASASQPAPSYSAPGQTFSGQPDQQSQFSQFPPQQPFASAPAWTFTSNEAYPPTQPPQASYPQLPFPPYVPPEDSDTTQAQQYYNPPSQH